MTHIKITKTTRVVMGLNSIESKAVSHHTMQKLWTNMEQFFSNQPL